MSFDISFAFLVAVWTSLTRLLPFGGTIFVDSCVAADEGEEVLWI